MQGSGLGSRLLLSSSPHCRFSHVSPSNLVKVNFVAGQLKGGASSPLGGYSQECLMVPVTLTFLGGRWVGLGGQSR